MTIQDKYREVLNKLAKNLMHNVVCQKNDCYQIKPDDPHFGITPDQALKDLLAINREVMPEKMTKKPKDCSGDDYALGIMAGNNSCLDEIDKIYGGSNG